MKHRLQTKWRFVAAVAVTLVVGLGCAAAEKGRQPLAQPDDSVAVASGNRIFRVPLGYARLREPSYIGQDHWWLEALWPGLLPWRAGNAEDARAFHAPGGGRQVKIQVSFGGNLDGYLDRLAGARSKPADPGSVVLDALWQRSKAVDQFGLQVYRIDFDRVASELNVTVRTDFDKARWEDWYVRVDPATGSIVTLIQCASSEVADPPEDAKPGVRVVPQCAHHFVMPQHQARVQLRYRRVHLPEWQRIEQAVRAKVTAFEQK